MSIIDNSEIKMNGIKFGNDFKLPLLRGTFPKLMAEDLVNVQPMQNDIKWFPIHKNLKKIFSEKEFIESLEEFIKKEEFNM